jgi:hypothetical protein
MEIILNCLGFYLGGWRRKKVFNSRGNWSIRWGTLGTGDGSPEQGVSPRSRSCIM